MIFQFTITGLESEVQSFEKELITILLKIYENKVLIANDILFCVHEAIMNIIQHTYHWDLKEKIDIRIQISESTDFFTTIEFFIRDFGDPIRFPVEPPTHINRFQLRKRGLYMINKIMDIFRLEPQEKNGNLTYMKKTVKQDELN